MNYSFFREISIFHGKKNFVKLIRKLSQILKVSPFLKIKKEKKDDQK